MPDNATKFPVAILGTGNIGTDLLVKVLRSPELDCKLFAGRNLGSAGMTKATALGVPVSADGINGIVDRANEISLVFDASSAEGHLRHAPLLKQRGIVCVDMTPAKVGRMCVPAVNLSSCLTELNVNMVTCGGQAAIPIAHALATITPRAEYMETVSNIAARSAGPATRINLDEYLRTTEQGIQHFTGCSHAKAILTLNPAQPCVLMQTTIMLKTTGVDLDRCRMLVAEAVATIQKYVPGYQVLLEPTLDCGRLIVMVKVEGLGDYLPRYAGNLDIINCAAIAFAEAKARHEGARK